VKIRIAASIGRQLCPGADPGIQRAQTHFLRFERPVIIGFEFDCPRLGKYNDSSHIDSLLIDVRSSDIDNGIITSAVQISL
jgi:hypothetical protein